jgi:hypothetical protein
MQRKGQLQIRFAVAMLLTLIFIVSLGCGSTPDATTASAPAPPGLEMTPDGLIKVATEGRGSLYLRPGHGVGGYDSVVVAPAFVNYRRKSVRLDPEDEEAYLASLEQAAIDQAKEIGAPIVYQIGECTIKVGIGFLNVNLAKSESAEVLGEMLLVIEYQDSMSGESLMRVTIPQRIEREPEGVSRVDHVSMNFDQMIDEAAASAGLREATAIPSSPRPGCEGRLLNAGLPSAED